MKRGKYPKEEYKRLHSIYYGMRKRCYNKNCKRYKDYGGRGIKICEEWEKSDNFVEWALSHGYADGLTIDRIDVDGDYSPENCRWITLKEQGRNKRSTIWVTYHGERKPLIVWCEELNLNYDAVHNRITALGMNVEDAFEKPMQYENSLRSKCIKLGLNYGTIRCRINRLGWSEERALNTPCMGRGANSKTYRRYKDE